MKSPAAAVQLGVLIENMRREGFELAVARASSHMDDDGNLLEPIEEVVIDVDDDGIIQASSSMKSCRRKSRTRRDEARRPGKPGLSCMRPRAR
ncbi:MAG: hypothetical protein R3C58_11005 [Parvularculaceae bacterium]